MADNSSVLPRDKQKTTESVCVQQTDFHGVIMEYYEMKIAGLTRKLPVCAVSDTLSIAGFIMFGDVEVTKAAATELLAKAPDFDLIFTAECKSIPLAYEMARQSGKNYIVARKGLKAYMTEPVNVQVKSITTAAVQHLYVGSEDVKVLCGKRVLIVDDVISTGASLAAMEELSAKSGATVVGKMAVLAEGDAQERTDIVYLERLPLFFK